VSRPALNSMQLAWLEEIGLDRSMLAHFAVAESPFAEPAAQERGPQRADGPAPQPSVAESAQAPTQTHDTLAAPAATGQGLQPAPAAQVMAALRGGAASPGGRKNQDTAPPAVAPQAPRVRQPIPADWEGLRQHMAECVDCGLQAARSSVVPGGGQTHEPAWMVVGEAPGNRDDREGLPFQGKAGVLLRSMLSSIGIDSEAQVFFTNIVKCRPLGNRPPTPEEIAACKPYLDHQIAQVRPVRILALGTLAAQTLLGRQEGLDELRGAVHGLRDLSGRDIPVVATYHPAALLLRPQHKIDAWRDLNLARSLMRAQ
jgi:DNA polymerase